MRGRLFRSQSDCMVGGVCAGLAIYLQVDVTLVRLFFVLMAMGGGGIGVMVYLLLWIILPVEGQERNATLEDTVRIGSEEIADRARAMGDDLRGMVRNPNPQAGRLIGVGLVLMGAVFLLKSLRLPWLSWLDFDILWPILLIAGGLALLRKYFLE